MDDVIEKFNSTLTSDKNSEFVDLYKNRGRLGNQEERRRELLELQKSKRNRKVDKFRGILDLVDAVEEATWRNQNKVHYRPNIYVAGFNKVSPTYRNVLMLSEWLVEKPTDFDQDWYVVPSPKGCRVLLVANRGITKCFSKYGQFKFQFRSALPGGNPIDRKQKVQCCVLDCIYQDKNKTMYILDLLAWNSQTMTDGEAEFRHYWLSTQLAEFADLRILTAKNELIFSLLPKISCDAESFKQFMQKYPAFEGNFPQLDGLLFYHKKAHYIAGDTPLVGWLFPYMVQEILGKDIPVHENYIASKPFDYVNQLDFIEKFEAKYAKKHKYHQMLMESDVPANNEEKDDVKKMEAEEVAASPKKEIMEAAASLEKENMEADATEDNSNVKAEPKEEKSIIEEKEDGVQMD